MFKSNWISRHLAYGFLLPLNTFERSKSNNEGDISQRHKICDVITPVWPMGGQGKN